MADYGFRVAKTGYDVSTATPDQLAMTSLLVSEKVALYGSVSMTLVSPATTVTATINHNLGYVPQVRVYEFTIDTETPFVAGDTSSTYTSITFKVTSTTLTFIGVSNTGNTILFAPIYQILYNSI